MNDGFFFREMEYPETGKPDFYAPVKHRGTRRASWHDYTSRCIYMITISRNHHWKKPFSIIRNGGYEPDGKLRAVVELSPIGKIFMKELYALEEAYDELEVVTSVIMPDHIHFLLFVRYPFQLGLGKGIRRLKGRCTDEIRKIDDEFASRNISAFEKGFNDRIVKQEGMRERFIRYIHDNPRRLLMRRLFPDFFRRKFIVSNGEKKLAVYGNINLLKEPVKSALVISSRYSEEDKERLRKEWKYTLRECGVFVSPFISPAEKCFRDKYLAAGCSMIRIQHSVFPKKFKPANREFELCCQGRLLLVAPVEELEFGKKELTRRGALWMNNLARYIAAQDGEGWVLKRKTGE